MVSTCGKPTGLKGTNQERERKDGRWRKDGSWRKEGGRTGAGVEIGARGGDGCGDGRWADGRWADGRWNRGGFVGVSETRGNNGSEAGWRDDVSGYLERIVCRSRRRRVVIRRSVITENHVKEMRSKKIIWRREKEDEVGREGRMTRMGMNKGLFCQRKLQMTFLFLSLLFSSVVTKATVTTAAAAVAVVEGEEEAVVVGEERKVSGGGGRMVGTAGTLDGRGGGHRGAIVHLGAERGGGVGRGGRGGVEEKEERVEKEERGGKSSNTPNLINFSVSERGEKAKEKEEEAEEGMPLVTFETPWWQLERRHGEEGGQEAEEEEKQEEENLEVQKGKQEKVRIRKERGLESDKRKNRKIESGSKRNRKNQVRGLSFLEEGTEK